MKKLFAVILTALLILTACGEGEKPGNGGGEYAEGYETARMSNRFSNLNLNGMFYTEDYDGNGFSAQRLWFFDFDSMRSALMCAMPNCRHDDPETCTAFNMDDHPTVVGNNLYFFRCGAEWDKDGKLRQYRYVYKAELDGSSRTKIDVIEDFETFGDLVVKGPVAYFTALYREQEDHTGVYTGYEKAYICSYDFEKEKFTNYGMLKDGYGASGFITGEYNGCLYIRGSYIEDRDGYKNGAE